MNVPIDPAIEKRIRAAVNPGDPYALDNPMAELCAGDAEHAAIHLDLDSAWPTAELPMPTCDVLDWGPHLRYSAPGRVVEAFLRHVEPKLATFLLCGSGDFHYLTALWLRRIQQTLTLVCFDNHPDWDMRPPHWSCGGWINRTLELPQVARVAVWGCGNFELAWPSRLFANHRAIKSGKLEVHGWAERQRPSTQKRFDCMTRENWRERFARFAGSRKGHSVYVTIDLDCLSHGEAVTNWESGLFVADDLVWALGTLRSQTQIVGGDLCGAYSPALYSRWKQRFAADWDHPKFPPVDRAAARRVNRAALDRIWPV